MTDEFRPDEAGPAHPGQDRPGQGRSDHPHQGRHDDGGASAEPGGADEFDAFIAEQLADLDAELSEDMAAADVDLDVVAAQAEASAPGETHPDTALAAERLADLQRLQAEYVNYKRRVDRDRDVARELGVQGVLDALLPVLDDLHAARMHGDLAEGPFALIADKLEKTLGRFGLERYGAAGEAFDPMVHEALMHLPDAELPGGASGTTVVQVLMPGYRIGEKVLRAARVAVADAP